MTWQGPQDPLAPANLRRLTTYGQKLQAMPGVERVVSIVNLPATQTPAAAAAFWRAVQRPPGAGVKGTSGASSGSAGASLPGLLQGLLGAQQRAAALRLKALTTAPGTVLFEVVPKAPPSTVAAQDLAVRVYDQGPPAGTTLYVGGTSMTVYDFVHVLYQKFPWIILFVVCVTALVLLLLLRSVVLPIKAVIMNVLSLLAGYGAVVWIFQDGHLEWLFHFRSSGAIDAELPVILFCTVFGVSMDYEVFLLTRMREAWDRDRRQRPGRALRPGAHRPHHHQRRLDHRRRRDVVRLHLDPRHQSDRRGSRRRRRARRQRDPHPHGPRVHAPARTLELVAAALARARSAAHRVAAGRSRVARRRR